MAISQQFSAMHTEWLVVYPTLIILPLAVSYTEDLIGESDSERLLYLSPYSIPFFFVPVRDLI
jgi:hypothetical protein